MWSVLININISLSSPLLSPLPDIVWPASISVLCGAGPGGAGRGRQGDAMTTVEPGRQLVT